MAKDDIERLLATANRLVRNTDDAYADFLNTGNLNHLAAAWQHAAAASEQLKVIHEKLFAAGERLGHSDHY